MKGLCPDLRSASPLFPSTFREFRARPQDTTCSQRSGSANHEAELSAGLAEINCAAITVQGLDKMLLRDDQRKAEHVARNGSIDRAENAA